jgi:[protein-PII] uridylyltransferase
VNEAPTQSEGPRLNTAGQRLEADASHEKDDWEGVTKGTGLGPSVPGPLQSYLTTRDSIVANGPGGLGAPVNTILAASLDECLRVLAASAPEVAIVAVGGYGRSELCLYSDIDLLLLHEGPVDQDAVRTILYPLWNSGLKIGHATRTVKGTLGFARDDLSTLCTVLSARLVAGPSELLAQLNQGLGRLLSSPRTNLTERLAAEERSVWEREPFALQDLDVKNGRGGLRSLHRLDWDRRRSELVGEEPEVGVAPGEIPVRRTLLAVRQALHAVQRRSADRFALDLRTSVGAWLGQDPAELATHVYRAARFADGMAAARWGRIRPGGVDPIAHAGLAVVRFVRARWARGETAATPLAFARAAVASDAAGRLSAWEREFAARSGPPEWTSGDRSGFVALLASGRPGWEAILGLWEAGWLSRALPEIGHLHGLAQVAPFHRHPVDAHLGATVANIVDLADGSAGWCAELAEEMGSLDEVLLSGFLHDIGKGLGGNHSRVGADLAASLLRRTGFGAATVSIVGQAVRHHLLLSETAARRDIEDPTVANEVAAVVGNQDLLRVLTLVSVADAIATGPDMWSTWKESLVRTLVGKVSALLEGTVSDLSAELERTIGSLVPELSRQQISDHLAGMPPGYVARFGADLVAQHLRLVHPAVGFGQVRVSVVPGAPVSTIITASQDRPGLLATITGVLAIHNLGVLEARVVTRSDGLALDTFRVQDSLGSDMIGQGRWPGVRESLQKAVAGEIDLETRLAEKRAAYGRGGEVSPPAIRVYPKAGGLTIDIRASDRVGLLHDLARAMAMLGLEVELAKIDTRGKEALDVFEVKNPAAHSEEVIASTLVAAAFSRQ